MSFELDLSRFASRTKDKVENVRRATVISLFGSIIRDTPVDTGRLRGNWQTTIGAPAAGEIGIRSAEAALGEVNDVAKEAGSDKAVWLANNLPYAYAIEMGHSKKAPQGMVRRNMIRVQRIVSGAVRGAR